MPEHQQTQKSTESKTTSQKQATPRIQTPVSNPFSIIQRARMNPKSLTHADVMQLQSTIGNRAVVRLLTEIGAIPSKANQAPPVQRQELVQRQEIPEEEEPLQGKMAETVQRQEIPEEEESLQGKFENKPEIACPSCFVAPIVQRQEIPEEEEPLQGKMIGTIQRQEIPEEEEPLQTKRENNTGMPDNLKAGVENLSGIDMSDVRVHYNSSKPVEVGALAYTQGTNIHVAPGQDRHLPHEAWHVVQQAQGRVRPTIHLKDMSMNDDVGLEMEADKMGQHVYNSSHLPVTRLQMLGTCTSGPCQMLTEAQEKELRDYAEEVCDTKKYTNIEKVRKKIEELIITYANKNKKTDLANAKTEVDTFVEQEIAAIKAAISTTPPLAVPPAAATTTPPSTTTTTTSSPVTPKPRKEQKVVMMSLEEYLGSQTQGEPPKSSPSSASTKMGFLAAVQKPKIQAAAASSQKTFDRSKYVPKETSNTQLRDWAAIKDRPTNIIDIEVVPDQTKGTDNTRYYIVTLYINETGPDLDRMRVGGQSPLGHIYNFKIHSHPESADADGNFLHLKRKDGSATEEGKSLNYPIGRDHWLLKGVNLQ